MLYRRSPARPSAATSSSEPGPIDTVGYGEVAAASNPETIAERCPLSFAPFWRELTELAEGLGESLPPRPPSS